MRRITLAVAAGALLVAAGCRETAAPAAAQWTFGPGCTLIWTFPLSDSTSELVVQHVDLCPRVVMDSTRR